VRFRRLLVDITPLKESPAFRRLWAGGGLSAIGGQMTNYAVVLQVFLLTHSTLAVGLVGAVIAVPSIFVALVAGAVIDASDRRRTVLLGTSVQVLLSAVLAVQAFAEFNHVSLLYCLVGLQAVVGAVSAPARRTFMPTLLAPDQLPAGAALQMFTMHGSLTVGPALAGVITAAFGLKVCYLVDALSFGFSLYGVARLPSRRPVATGAGRGPRAVAEGLRFVLHRRVVLGAFAADMSATFLGMPFALFPAINAERFGGRAETLGLLTTAIAVGGIIGSALSGPVSRVSRQGLGMLVAGSVWGAGLIAFGFAHAFWLAFLSLTLAGTGDVTAVVLRTALVQGVTPNRLRGRVSAAEFAVGAGVPQLGNFRSGAVASVTSPTISVVGGGVATVAGAVLVGAFIPALVTFRSGSPPSGQDAEAQSFGGP
jgi:MFS family permease